MRVIHVGPSQLPIGYRYGGAIERRMVEVAVAQSRLGMKVVIYSASQRDRSELFRGAEIRHESCRMAEPFRRFEYLFHVLRDLKARNERPDVIHFHSVPEGALFFSRLKVKTYLSYDNYFFSHGKRTPLFLTYRKLLQKFTALLPVSNYCLDRSRDYWDLDPTSMYVIYNGVNLDQFSPDMAAGEALKVKLGISGEKTVLYVGRICEQKGTDLLLDAYQDLRARVPNVKLVVAGPPAQFGRSGKTIITERIKDVGGIYLGAVAEDILASVYNLADVFVMPTRDLEMFGMAALEAQACGKPVVCSRHGGLTEVVTNESGLFFPVGNVKALVDALRVLLSDEPMRLFFSRAARKNAERFNWDRVVVDLKKAYEES